MANKAIVYAIYPNIIQDEQCQKTFGCCRRAYSGNEAFISCVESIAEKIRSRG